MARHDDQYLCVAYVCLAIVMDLDRILLLNCVEKIFVLCDEQEEENENLQPNQIVDEK